MLEEVFLHAVGPKHSLNSAALTCCNSCPEENRAQISSADTQYLTSTDVLYIKIFRECEIKSCYIMYHKL
jgi:hypothetical protein